MYKCGNEWSGSARVAVVADEFANLIQSGMLILFRRIYIKCEAIQQTHVDVLVQSTNATDVTLNVRNYVCRTKLNATAPS